MLASLQMLDITTNPNINCGTNSTSATATTTSISLDDEMDPLFDNDWLHEHNLDILFDLFEEEMGTSTGKANAFQDSNFNNSSAVFGSSPLASYLFGTSPSLANAIDLYDLLYFDNQQQPIINTTSSSSSLSSSSSSSSSSISSNTNHQQSHATSTNNINNASINSTNIQPNSTSKNSSGSAQKIQNVSTNHIANSITNALKIKKKLKRSQNEGISLLAKPNLGNTNGRGCSNNSNLNSISNSSSSSSGCCTNNGSSNIKTNNSDNASTKLTNLKKNISSGSIDINVAKQTGRNNHHSQFVTGLAVIREHAYAARDH